MNGTTSIASITLEVDDVTTVERFYATAFGLGSQLRLRAGDAPATGFRGFTLALTVSQPADAGASSTARSRPAPLR